jgi:zinc transporter ZupT
LIFLILALIAGAATILGGALALYTGLKNVDLRYLAGFSAGVLISTALLVMLPEVKGSLWAAGLGFFFLYFFEKLTIIHACQERECPYKFHHVGWLPVSGLTLDNVVDGAGIAVGSILSPILGVTVALAVATHELPQGLSMAVIMKAKYRGSKILIALFLAAMFTPLGALLSFLIPEAVFEHILAFAAGTFIYIGASDLLPEAHEKFNLKVILSVLLGGLLITALGIWT